MIWKFGLNVCMLRISTILTFALLTLTVPAARALAVEPSASADTYNVDEGLDQHDPTPDKTNPTNSRLLATSAKCTTGANGTRSCRCYSRNGHRVPCDDFGPPEQRSSAKLTGREVNLLCYDATYRYLNIRIDRVVYQYCNVPPTVHAKLQGTPDIAAAFAAHVQNTFTCRSAQSAPPTEDNACFEAWRDMPPEEAAR